MTENFDPYDDEANLRRHQQEVLAELAEKRTRLFLSKRPRVFSQDGPLRPQIAAWCDNILNPDPTNPPGPLVLVGGVGAGKTWSLWKAGETLTRNGWRGRFDIVPAHQLKEATTPPVDREQLHAWRDADILAIDDIGAIRVSDWDLDNLHALIDHRWMNQLPTVIASNSPQLRQLLGDRAASRLQDGATIVQLGDTDRRRNR